MDGHELHHADAADVREHVGDGQDTLRQDISALVGLYKQHFGKGPTAAVSIWSPTWS